MSSSLPTHLALSLPLLTPLATAMISVLLGTGRRRQMTAAIVGSSLSVVLALWVLVRVVDHGVLVMYLGGWEPPYGIAFAADRLSAVMLLLAALITLLAAIYAAPTLPDRRRLARFVTLLHLMQAAMNAFFLAADIFNFFVWFELLLVASFGLMILDSDRPALEGTLKYFVLNIIGSMLLLTGIALLYAMAGTLNLADLATRLPAIARPHLTGAIAALFLVALGIKSAVFPLFFWLPASYHLPPIPVIVMFGGVLTKVGVYGLLRLFTLVFVQVLGWIQGLVLVIGTLTMILGVLGAVAQTDLRRLLAFHVISQIGYMLVAVGFGSPLGVTAAVFFMIHILVTKSALFFVGGVIARAGGSFNLHELAGLYRSRPMLAVLFLVPALSLGGIPPLSGFFGKLSVVQAGLEAGHHGVVAASLAVGLLTLYSMSKIWMMAFWSPSGSSHPAGARPRLPVTLWLPAAVLMVATIGIGFAAGPLLELASQAAVQLIEHQAYIDAVLGEARR